MDKNSLIQQLLLTIEDLRAASANATSKSVVTQGSVQSPQKRSRSPDELLPIEIWERTLTYLYPSQIARLSRVSRTMYSIPAASRYWSRLFRCVFGPKSSFGHVGCYTRTEKLHALHVHDKQSSLRILSRLCCSSTTKRLQSLPNLLSLPTPQGLGTRPTTTSCSCTK